MTANQLRIALVRVERAVKDRLGMAETEGFKPADLNKCQTNYSSI